MDGNFLGDAMCDGLQLRKLSRDTLHSRRSAEKPPIASLLLGGFLYKVLKLEQSSNQKLIIRITNYKLDIVCL